MKLMKRLEFEKGFKQFATITTSLFRQEAKYIHSNRMPHGLGIPCCPLFLFSNNSFNFYHAKFFIDTKIQISNLL
jgi:hypothetical protein